MTMLVSSRLWSAPAATRSSNPQASLRHTESDGGVASDDIRRATILLVDDDDQTLEAQRILATEGFLNVSVTDRAEAIRQVRESDPDLVVIAGTAGTARDCELLRKLQSEECAVPLLMLIDDSQTASRAQALELGVSDFVRQPVEHDELIPRVRTLLLTKTYRERLFNQAEELERQVRRRTAELTAARADLVHCLARAAEYRDDDMGHHVVRVGRYVGLIARRLNFPESYVELIELAAQLHDIGKIGIPDEILYKPGALDPEQYERMKQHVAIGHQIIQPLHARDWELLKTHARLGGSMLQMTSSPLLVLAAKIAQTHHERWDGSGYPLGLAGDDIPIEGRIAAVADVYDALSSKRPYKKALSRPVCFQILEEGRGNHFDPQVLDAFFACREEIVKVQLEYMDPVQ